MQFQLALNKIFYFTPAPLTHQQFKHSKLQKQQN